LRRLAVHRAGSARALLACVAVALAIAGCGSGDDDPGPGGVTVGEARALDEAAEMLDERRPPDAALPDAGETAAEPPAGSEG